MSRSAVKVTFDIRGFAHAVESRRRAENMTLREVGRHTGISASTLSRLMDGKGLDLDILAALAAWSGADLNSFVNRPRRAPPELDTLSKIGAALRTDRRLDDEDAAAIDKIVRLLYGRLAAG